jgi:hypothetical protein
MDRDKQSGSTPNMYVHFQYVRTLHGVEEGIVPKRKLDIPDFFERLHRIFLPSSPLLLPSLHNHRALEPPSLCSVSSLVPIAQQ